MVRMQGLIESSVQRAIGQLGVTAGFMAITGQDEMDGGLPMRRNIRDYWTNKTDISGRNRGDQL